MKPKRLTDQEFFALPTKEQLRVLDAEYEANTRRSVWESLQDLKPVPRTKTTVGFRVHRNSPFVIHFRKHGRWWKWWIYCDGWSEPRSAGKSEEIEVTLLEACEAMVAIYCRRWVPHSYIAPRRSSFLS